MYNVRSGESNNLYSDPDCEVAGFAFDRNNGTAVYAQCGGFTSSNTLVALDLASGSTTQIAAFSWSDILPAMACNPVDDHLYSIHFDESKFTYELVKFSKKGESLTTIHSFFRDVPFHTLAINANGEAFASDDNYLYSINLEDGTQVRLSGSLPAVPFLVLGFDGNGVLYGGGGMDDPVLLTINVTDTAFTTTTAAQSPPSSFTAGDFCPL